MAAPTPQQQKLSALERALAAQRESQEAAKAAAERAKSKPTP